MEEQLVSFEVAKLAKEKGFHQYEGVYFFSKDGDKRIDYYKKNYNKASILIAKPTQSLLQKWLREVHKIYVTAMPHEDNLFFKYNTRITDKSFHTGGTRLVQFDFEFGDYELALEKGLQEALKLINNIG